MCVCTGAYARVFLLNLISQGHFLTLVFDTNAEVNYLKIQNYVLSQNVYMQKALGLQLGLVARFRVQKILCIVNK